MSVQSGTRLQQPTCTCCTTMQRWNPHYMENHYKTNARTQRSSPSWACVTHMRHATYAQAREVRLSTHRNANRDVALLRCIDAGDRLLGAEPVEVVFLHQRQQRKDESRRVVPRRFPTPMLDRFRNTFPRPSVDTHLFRAVLPMTYVCIYAPRRRG